MDMDIVLSVIINFDIIRAVHDSSKMIRRKFAEKGIKLPAHGPFRA